MLLHSWEKTTDHGSCVDNTKSGPKWSEAFPWQTFLDPKVAPAVMGTERLTKGLITAKEGLYERHCWLQKTWNQLGFAATLSSTYSRGQAGWISTFAVSSNGKRLAKNAEPTYTKRNRTSSPGTVLWSAARVKSSSRAAFNVSQK